MKKLAYLITALVAAGISISFLAGCGGSPTATPTIAVVAPTAAVVVTPIATLPVATPTKAVVATPSVKVITPTATRPAASPTSGAAVPAVGNATSGQTIYTANCVVCHKADGSGGVQVGSVTSADLRQPSLQPTFKNDPALLSRAILNGKDETGGDLDTAMPRFAGKLTQQQVNDIIAYVITLK